MASQICYRCDVSKHLDEFKKHRGICKKCSNKEARKSREKWKEEMRDKYMYCKYCDKEVTGSEKKRKHMCKKCHNLRSDKIKRREKEKRKETDVSKNCSNCKEFLKYSNFTQQKEICNNCVYQRRRDRLSDSDQIERKCLGCGKIKNGSKFKKGVHKCRECHNIRRRKWSKRPDVREKDRDYRKQRREDPIYRLEHNYRSRVSALLKGRTRKGSMELLGCSIEEFKEHLEKKFRDGMTWKNYGILWQIDHIIPCASFDFSDRDSVSKCFYYTNLQPLTRSENASKWCRIDVKFGNMQLSQPDKHTPPNLA